MLSRGLCALAVCWSVSFEVLAVSVNINWLRRPVCTYSNGWLRADVAGGVGPYAFLWNTGDTVQDIGGLPTGTYSVTVTDFNGEIATDDYTLISVGYDLDEFTFFGHQGRCAEVDHLLLEEPSIPGPPPYFVDGQQMLSSANLPYHHPFIPTQNDTDLTFSFMDGNGCTGTIDARVGWPYEFPEVDFLDVQGSCTNDSSGSVSLQFGSDAHGQWVYGIVRGVNGYAGPSIFSNMPSTLYDMPPGDYFIEISGPSTGPGFAFFGCSDTTWFTIPDLGPACGSVRGRTVLDQNRDCITGNDAGVENQMVEVLPGPYYALTGMYGGVYGVQLPFGDYTVQQLGTVYEPHCQPDPIPFTINASTPSAHVDFADTSTVTFGTEVDMRVMMACGAARPGFEMDYTIRRSMLSQGPSGSHTLSMTFDSTLGFVNASPIPSSIAGNTLTWNLASIWGNPLGLTHIRFQVPPDIGLLGTVLNASATITTAQPDVDPTNNMVSHSCVITGAYDPNDKRARTSTGTSDTLYYVGADEYIDYTIRFQNTGTDTAFHVVVTDTIAPNLDLRTFIAGASSRGYELGIRNGNTLRFAFYNIQLPDSNVNEPASHGYVSFRIKPREPVLPGTTFENIANIYFDYNPPVITDPSVLVAEFSTGVKETEKDGVRIFPNPATETIHIQLPENTKTTITVFSADGRLVQLPKVEREQRIDLDVRSLSPGIYFLQTASGSGRFVKQ